jgi:spore coat protein CotH
MCPHRPLNWRALGLTVAAVWLCAVAPAIARGQTQEAVFSDSTLHEIRLTISQRDWQALKAHFDQDTYYAADLRWNNLTLRNVGIRSRGNITRNGLKPGLRIDFNRYLSDQQLFGLTALVLDNAYTDPSLLHERLAMTLFNRIGVAAPREASVRLFVNEAYAGAYVIVESIDRAFIAPLRNEAHSEQGGHLFEYRWVRPYGFEYLGAELEAYAEVFTPQTHQTESMVGLFGELEEMVRTINDATDERFVADVGRYLDLPLFMRYLAVENFLAESDGLVGEWGFTIST